MATALIGRLYRYRDSQSGYFMVMSKGPTHIELSPLFWREEVVSFFHSRSHFGGNEGGVPPMFERIEETPGYIVNNPAVCGRYDRECHRRWKIIADGKQN
jgi:hypothetical protein